MLLAPLPGKLPAQAPRRAAVPGDSGPAPALIPQPLVHDGVDLRGSQVRRSLDVVWRESISDRDNHCAGARRLLDGETLLGGEHRSRVRVQGLDVRGAHDAPLDRARSSGT